MGCGGSKEESTEAGRKKESDDRVVLRNGLMMNFKLNEDTLQHFLLLEREIALYEQRHIPETLEVRVEQMDQLRANIKKMEEEHARLTKESQKVKSSMGRLPYDRSVKQFILGQKKHDEITAYEKAEQLAILNKLEILQKEIDGTNHHVAELQQEVDVLREDKNDLLELYDYEENILESVFHGYYGSEHENKLEDELTYLKLVMQKVEEANFKWRQAQVMIEYACKQIGTAVEKWKEIMKLPLTAIESIYKLGEETRNNLIAAAQNLHGAHRYLPHIKFPYCTLEEIEMLEKATEYLYTDMQAKQRQIHARDTYSAGHRRSAALLQWFNEVINSIITENILKYKEKVKKKSHELRMERVNLIKLKVKQQYGKDIEVSSADMNFDGNPEKDSNLSPNDKRSRPSSGQSITVRGSYSNLSYSNLSNAPSPIPRKDLAPLPTLEELFGKTEQLKMEHEKNMNKLNEATHMQRNNKINNHDVPQNMNPRRPHQSRINNDKNSYNRSISNMSKTRRNNEFRHPHGVEVLEDIDGDIMMDANVMRHKRERY